jgi:hypothetical protein
MRKPLFVLFALLALLAGACSDGDSTGLESDSTDTDGSDETTSTTAGGLALEDWVSQADTICGEAREQLEGLGEPTTADELVEMLPDAIEISSGELEELQGLGAPDEQADVVEQLLDLGQRRIDLLQQMLDDIEGGADPEQVFEEANTEIEGMTSEARDLAEDLGTECGARTDEPDPTTPTSDSTTSTTSGGSGGEVPETGDPVIDEMLAQCAEGNGIACDQAYALTEVGSEAEAFADTCGDTEDPGSICASILQGSKVEPELYTGADSYGDDQTLDGYYDECEGGDMSQCDLLFLVSPVGSGYEEFGGTCGGTFSLEDSPFSCAAGS